MLKLKHTYHLDFPHITWSPKQMELSPVLADNDELTQAIERDNVARDDAWELSERPDMGELTEFWNHVEQDVASDPQWFRFEND